MTDKLTPTPRTLPTPPTDADVAYTGEIGAWQDYALDLKEYALQLERELAGMRGKVVEEWIAVGDRLPETSESVIIYQGDASHTKVTAYYFFGKWRWTDSAYEHSCNPSHWQPLPAPPIGAKSE